MRPDGPSLKPAAAYLRRSTDRQEASLQDQRRDILRYAMEQGFAVVTEFVDDGVSGTSGEARKGFLAMVAEAQSRARTWNTILVWDIKRFGRMSSDEVGFYRHTLSLAGVEVVYTSEGFSGSSSDRYMRFFKQEAARDESATLSKAVIRGMVGLADEGWWTGGQAPYGYDLGYFDSAGKLFQIVRHTDAGEKVILNPDGSLRRTVDRGHKSKASRSEHVRLLRGTPERVETLQQIFAWYTGPHSMGFKAIADRLNHQGIASARGKGWSLSSIRAILGNQVYTGRLVWNMRQMGKFHRVADRREVERDGCGKRRVQRNAREDWLVFENAHEALVDQVTFERTRRIMKERGDRANAAGFLTGTAKVSRYLLSGLLTCGECGGSMFGQTQWKKEPRKDGSRIGTGYYICSAAVMKGKAICQPVRFLQHALDDYVADLIGRRLSGLLGASGRATLR